MRRASSTLFARSDPSQTPAPAPAQHTDSSFFTFLIALLILVFASGALVLRAMLLRRRFRSRVRAAIAAGILPPQPSSQRRPELYEVCVRAASGVLDWNSLMPVCATGVGQPARKRPPNAPVHTSSAAARFMELLGHPALTTASVAQQPTLEDDTSSKHSILIQVAVLIAMPAAILPTDVSTPPDSIRGKRRDSSLVDDTLPDVMLGVTTLPMSSDSDV